MMVREDIDTIRRSKTEEPQPTTLRIKTKLVFGEGTSQNLL